MNQTVFITGVSSGLGSALAAHYLNTGATVLGCSRRQPNDLMSHPNFRFAAIDLSDFAQIPEQLSQLFSDTVHCDLAILNAGILSPFGDLRDVSLEECQRVMDTNLWANKVLIDWLMAESFPVNQVAAISSGAGVHGKRGWNAYAISKAALNMLITLYASECPDTHFSAIGPGPIDTAMQEWLYNLPTDERFPTLDSLKSRRHTSEMPTAEQLAPELAEILAAACERSPTGSYIDIRKLPW